MTTFEDLLAADGKLVYKTHGTSMEPMLRQDRDLVIVKVPDGRLKVNDVALYRRGPKYVLHRVIAVCDGFYLIRGDNTYATEKVPDSAVIGVLSAFKRKGKDYSVTDVSYLRYVRFCNATYPFRCFFYRIRRGLIKIAVKLGVAPALRKLRRRLRRSGA